MRWLLGLAGVIGLALGTGCSESQSRDCTEMGCVQGVTLTLATPLEQPGEYQFDVVADGEPLTCAATIPPRGDGTEEPCSEGVGINREIVTTRTNDAIVGTSGDAIVSVGLGGEINQVSVTVTRDGTEILSAAVAPEYVGVEINGEGCGECPMATHTIE